MELLLLLCGDQDTEIRHKASETLSKWNVRELQEVLSHPGTPRRVLDSAAETLGPTRPELLDALLQNPALSDDLLSSLGKQLLAALPEQPAAVTPEELPPPPKDAVDEGPQSLLQKIRRMSLREKVLAALTGNMETRMILIRDPSKLVARSVLQSPRISETEIEGYAASRDLPEEILRNIATKREFIKNYSIVRCLVSNPRVPTEVTFPMVNRLVDKDLKIIAKNRDVPELIRRAAGKVLTQRQEAAKIDISKK